MRPLCQDPDNEDSQVTRNEERRTTKVPEEQGNPPLVAIGNSRGGPMRWELQLERHPQALEKALPGSTGNVLFMGS